jgi:hypothetical protein
MTPQKTLMFECYNLVAHGMRGCNFLGLISNKVTLRSYNYFSWFIHLIFGKNEFFQLCPQLPSFAKKIQEILGVNMNIQTSKEEPNIQTSKKKSQYPKFF